MAVPDRKGATMRRLDAFSERIRCMSKNELEATLLESSCRVDSYDAAAWLAKTRELGGPDSRLGRTQGEALGLLRDMLPNIEYEAVVRILLQVEPSIQTPASL